MIKGAIPVLHTASSALAEVYYMEQLGFRQLFAYWPDAERPDPAYMGFARDGAEIHISSFSGDGVAGSCVYLHVDDVDALYEEFKARGVAIDLTPTDQTWGNREMYLRDPDGNALRFIQPGQQG